MTTEQNKPQCTIKVPTTANFYNAQHRAQQKDL